MRFELLALSMIIVVGCGTPEKGDDGSGAGPGGDEQCTDCNEPEPLTCENLEFTTCGGDIVGTWALNQYCGEPVVITDPVVSLETCADSLKTLTLFPTVLTQTFNDDLSYSILASSTVDFVADVSPECVDAIVQTYFGITLPFATACNYGEQILTDGQDDITWEAIECSVDGERCKCAGNGATKDITDTGTYTTTETGTVTLLSDRPDFSEFDGDTEYCIMDEQLVAHDTTDAGQEWYAILDPDAAE